MLVAIQLLVGMTIGTVLLAFALPLLPGAVDRLTNDPNKNKPDEPKDSDKIKDGDKTTKSGVPNYKKNTFGFFTYIQPGRNKILVRGGKPVRVLMDDPGFRFKGDASEEPMKWSDPEYWETEKIEKGKPSHPIPAPWKGDLSPENIPWGLILRTITVVPIAFFVWKRWVYNTTGAVFTGLYPFQTVWVYPHEHFRRVTLEDGTVKLERVLNWSDHFRMREFQFPLIVPKADTQDRIPLKILLNMVARCVNAFKLAFNTDDQWSGRLLATGTNAAAAYTRAKTAEDVLSAKDADGATELSRTVLERCNEEGDAQEGSLLKIGLKIDRVEVLDISTADTGDEKILGETARAKVQREATILRAEGDAERVRLMGVAAGAHPASAHIAELDALVRAAEATAKNGGIVILNGPSISQDTALLAREIRKPKT